MARADDGTLSPGTLAAIYEATDQRGQRKSGSGARNTGSWSKVMEKMAAGQLRGSSGDDKAREGEHAVGSSEEDQEYPRRRQQSTVIRIEAGEGMDGGAADHEIRQDRSAYLKEL
mmetsp:Transcript_7866/g.18956  ORF Transcript_7866/g.18956 Transcript_7866/m.18956 type:complete len:115 (-) Transcript_7866:549-893(-)|eukprot:g14872.t1